jgi:predicted transcriptional regulator
MIPAIVEEYSDFLRAIANRRKELGLSQLDLDYKIGWADGYTGKIESFMRNAGAMSLAAALAALGLEIAVEPIADADDIDAAVLAAMPRLPAEVYSLEMEHYA